MFVSIACIAEVLLPATRAVASPSANASSSTRTSAAVPLSGTGVGDLPRALRLIRSRVVPVHWSAASDLLGLRMRQKKRGSTSDLNPRRSCGRLRHHLLSSVLGSRQPPGVGRRESDNPLQRSPGAAKPPKRCCLGVSRRFSSRGNLRCRYCRFGSSRCHSVWSLLSLSIAICRYLAERSASLLRRPALALTSTTSICSAPSHSASSSAISARIFLRRAMAPRPSPPFGFSFTDWVARVACPRLLRRRRSSSSASRRASSAASGTRRGRSSFSRSRLGPCCGWDRGWWYQTLRVLLPFPEEQHHGLHAGAGK